jgi:AcrR family transcriptional regulator
MGIKERREREREATQQVILQAALEIASQEGWQSVTIRRVAEHIEYSPSALYKYFEDKDAILHTLLLQGFQSMKAALERVAQAPTCEQQPEECLKQIAAAYWDFAWHQPTVYQMMFDLKGKWYEVEEAKAICQIIRVVVEAWGRNSEIQIGEIDRAVDILWAIIHGFVALMLASYISDDPLQAKETLAQVVSDLLFGWKKRWQTPLI